MQALQQFFVNPALALGVLAAAVPLVIHLLNRQRHKPLAWGAMRFVLAAYKRTRRRSQFENLLLLLLRMAAVALLALALARPFTGEEGLLAQLTEQRRNLVLILDDSASTGWRTQTQSVHERILERARALLTELDGARGDRVRLIAAGGHARSLSERSPEDALAMLSTLERPSDQGLALNEALELALRAAEEDLRTVGEVPELYLLSDLQRASFAPAPLMDSDAAAGARAPLLETLDRLEAAKLVLVVEDLGPAENVPANLCVESIEPLGKLLGVGLPIEVAVNVHNFGPKAVGPVRVALLVDGEKRGVQSVEIQAGAQAQVLFGINFAEAGRHLLEAELVGDGLALDDRRAQIVRVPPALRVLLVDGKPDPRIEVDATGLLAAVLAPMDDAPGLSSRFDPFQARVLDTLALSSELGAIAEADVIWLANVESLSRAAEDALVARVEAGATLVFSAGDRVTPEEWNARWFRTDGSGLLPAELSAARLVPDRRSAYQRIASFEEHHPALKFFADERWKPLLVEVPIYGYLGAKPLENARVLARLDDAEQSPLLIERSFDRGKVVLCTTSMDPSWARIAESPRTLVPLVHELLRYAGVPEQAPRNLPLGVPLIAEVSSFPRALELIGPEGTRRRIDAAVEQVAPAIWRLPPVQAPERVGVWRLRAEGASEELFALQFDTRESDLARLGAAELRSLHPALHPYQERGETGSEAQAAPRQGELWRLCAALALAALVAESIWAAYLGRRRR